MSTPYEQVLKTYLECREGKFEPDMIIVRPKPDNISQEDWENYIGWVAAGCPSLDE